MLDPNIIPRRNLFPIVVPLINGRVSLLRTIDNNVLSTTLRNKQTKHELVNQHPSLNIQLLNSLSNQWKFSEDNIRAYETALWIKSQKNLMGNKGRNEHKKVFVVPCTSQPARRDNQGNVYPEYIEGKGGSDGDGFSINTTVLLNEARYKTRITDKLGTVTDPFYKLIYDSLFLRLFESKSYSLKKVQELNDDAEKKLQEATEEIARLNLEITNRFAAAGQGEKQIGSFD